MEGNQDTEPNAGQLEPRRPLRSDGKPYSERHDPQWLKEMVGRRERRELHDRYGRDAAQQAAAQYFRGLQEFSGKSDAWIDKLSRGVVKAISRSTNISTKDPSLDGVALPDAETARSDAGRSGR